MTYRVWSVSLNKFLPWNNTRERSEIVEIYIQQNKSIVKTQHAFKKLKNVKSASSKNTIKRLYEKFSTGEALSNPNAINARGGHLRDIIFKNRCKQIYLEQIKWLRLPTAKFLFFLWFLKKKHGPSNMGNPVQK